MEPLNAAECLRNNLLYATLKVGTKENLEAIMEKVNEKAIAGDIKAAKFITDQVNAAAGNNRPQAINVEQAVMMSGAGVDVIVKIRERVAYMLADNGPMDLAMIKSRINAPTEILMPAVQCPWFTMSDGRWTITSVARRDLLDLPARIMASIEHGAG